MVTSSVSQGMNSQIGVTNIEYNTCSSYAQFGSEFHFTRTRQEYGS